MNERNDLLLKFKNQTRIEMMNIIVDKHMIKKIVI